MSALGGSYHIWRVCLFCCGIRRKRVEGTEVIIGDLRGVFFRNAMPSAPLGTAEPKQSPIGSVCSRCLLFSQVDPADLLTERKYGVGGDGEFIDAHLKEGLRDGEITAELTAHADPDTGFVCIFYRHLDEL